MEYQQAIAYFTQFCVLCFNISVYAVLCVIETNLQDQSLPPSVQQGVCLFLFVCLFVCLFVYFLVLCFTWLLMRLKMLGVVRDQSIVVTNVLCL